MTTQIKPGSLLVACEDCGHHYAIKAVHLGKKFRCVKCGSVTQMQETETETKHNLAQPKTITAQSPSQTPAKTVDIKTQNIQKALSNRVMAQALYDRQKVKRALEKGEDAYQVSKVREFYIPLGLLIVGLLIHLLWCPQWIGSIKPEMVWWQYLSIAIALQTILYFPSALGAIFLTARVYGVSFGSIKEVLLKLAVLTFGPGAVADGIFLGIAMGMSGEMMTPVLAFMPYVIMVGLPLALFFSLNFSETMLTVAIIYLPRFITFIALGLLLPHIYR